jgi:hypothetical protein
MKKTPKNLLGSRKTLCGFVRLPLARHLSWFAEWRHGESFQLYEGFRTHLVTTGLRLTRGCREISILSFAERKHQK